MIKNKDLRETAVTYQKEGHTYGETGNLSNEIKFKCWIENGELKLFYPVEDWQY